MPKHAAQLALVLVVVGHIFDLYGDLSPGALTLLKVIIDPSSLILEFDPCRCPHLTLNSPLLP